MRNSVCVYMWGFFLYPSTLTILLAWVTAVEYFQPESVALSFAQVDVQETSWL